MTPSSVIDRRPPSARSAPIRVLHCPSMVAGIPQELARAERRIGLRSVAVAFDESAFRYPTDEVLWSPRETKPVREWKRLKLLWRALRDFDIVHFNFGRTILPMASARRGQGWQACLQRCLDYCRGFVDTRELALLKRAGKGIVVSFLGDDARQGDFCRAQFQTTFVNEVEAGYYSAAGDGVKRQRIRNFDRFADRIYAVNPDLLHLLPGRAEFLPYCNVDPTEWQPVPRPGSEGRRLTVLHAPSHRGVKGTRFIREAVDRLKRDGLDFDFLLVENLPHADARRLYERADLLIDQLLAGWYGGLAVELMALGKPVMCYLRDDDLGFIPPAMRGELPMIRANPECVYSVLKEWLTARSHELPALGTRSRAFVEKWHDSTQIARRVRADYELILATIARRKR